MFTDYHTHTPLCKHAEGEPEAYVAQAIKRGLIEYGISDHAPMTPEPFDDWRMSFDDLPKYYNWIERAKAAAGSKLTIRAGLECDWLVGCEGWTETLAQQYEWDYLIGSVHYIGDQWDFDNPQWLGKWAEGDVDQFWKLYWDTYLQMVKSGLFDIYGHPDLIKKFGYFPQGDLKRYYLPIIEALADQEACIELNTAGWRKPCNEGYPSADFLTLAFEAGVEITLTSDAHKPEEIGQDFEKAADVLRSAGYKNLSFFEKRNRVVRDAL